MAKVNTLSDHDQDVPRTVQIDVKNLRNSINEVYNGVTTTQVVKDGSGSNITLTIVNGRITDIS